MLSLHARGEYRSVESREHVEQEREDEDRNDGPRIVELLLQKNGRKPWRKRDEPRRSEEAERAKHCEHVAVEPAGVRLLELLERGKAPCLPERG